MALFILLFLHLILEVHPQYPPRPTLSVSPTVISQSGSVQIDCKAQYEGVSQCYYYPEGQKTNVKLSPSCQLSLTGSELILWTGRPSSSPEPVNIICFYTLEAPGSRPSHHSLPAPVLILDAPQLSVSPAVITERGSVLLDCKAPYAEVSQCYFYPEGNEKNTKLSPSCQLSLTAPELTIWSGRSSRSAGPVSVVCHYSVSVSGVSKPSPHSLPAPVMILDQKPMMSVEYNNPLDEFTVVCEIPLSGSGSADFRCSLYTGHLQFIKTESRRRNSGKLVCIFTASRNDLFNRLQSVRSKEVSCDYSLNSDSSICSPMSDKYNLSVLLPAPVQFSTTVEKSTADLRTRVTQQSPTNPPETAVPVISTLRTEPTTPSLTDSTETEVCSTSEKKATTVLLPAPVQSSTTVEKSTADLRTRVPQQSPTNPPETAVPVISTLRTEPTTPSLTDSTETEVCSTSEKKATTGTFVRQQLVIALAVTATSAFLGGVMIIVLCRFIRKQRRKRFTINSKSRGDQGMMAMLSTEESGTGASGTYSVMSSMPTSFQPSGGTAPTNNCSDSDPQAKTYSEITSSAAPPEPSGSCKAKEIFEKTESGPQAEMYSKITLITDPPEPLGSCEAQENSKKIESDIYHMYCTIPDLHVTSKQNDSFYSLLQMQ